MWPFWDMMRLACPQRKKIAMAERSPPPSENSKEIIISIISKALISDKTLLREIITEMEKPEVDPEENRKKKIDLKIQMILKEIIDSEKKYVKTLTTIVEVQGPDD